MKMSEAFSQYLRAIGHSERSIKSRLHAFGQYTEWLDKEGIEVHEARYQEVLDYMRYCRKRGIKQQTVQCYIGAIKNYYAHAVKEGKVSSNPASAVEVKGIQRKQLHRVLDVHTLQKLYHEHPNETLEQQRDKVMTGLLVYQGLTVEELGKLEINDLKLREGQIEVPGGRKSNGRTLRLEAVQIMDVYDYTMRVRPALLEGAESTLLFITKGGSRYSISGMMKPLLRRLKQHHSGVVNANQIRASVITHWLKKYNLREVQYRAGHRYISSTEAYLQNDTESLQRDIDLYHPLG